MDDMGKTDPVLISRAGVTQDKATVINSLVNSASEIMAARADYCQMVAEQLREKDNHRWRLWACRARTIREAVVVMRDNEGTWG